MCENIDVRIKKKREKKNEKVSLVIHAKNK